MALRKKGRRKFGGEEALRFQEGGPAQLMNDWSGPPPSDALVRQGAAPGDKPYPGEPTIWEGLTYNPRNPVGPQQEAPSLDTSGMYPPSNSNYYEGQLVFPVDKPASPMPSMFSQWGWGRGSEPDAAQHEQQQQPREDWRRWNILQQQQAAGMPTKLQIQGGQMAKPPQPEPPPQRVTTFSQAMPSSSPATSSDVEVRPRDPTLKSDLDVWRTMKKGKAKGGAIRFQEGGGTGDYLLDEGDYGEEPAPAPRKFNPPAPAPPDLSAATPPTIGGGLPGAMPGSEFLPGVPPFPKQSTPATGGGGVSAEVAARAAAAAEKAKALNASPASLDERIRQQDLASWHNLWKQEGEDTIYSKSQQPLRDFIQEVGQGNVGAWHTQPGASNLALPNDPNSISIGFDPNGQRLVGTGQGWFYQNSRNPYTGDSVYNKTTVTPFGPAGSDAEPAVEQHYPQTTTAPTAAAPAAPAARAAGAASFPSDFQRYLEASGQAGQSAALPGHLPRLDWTGGQANIWQPQANPAYSPRANQAINQAGSALVPNIPSTPPAGAPPVAAPGGNLPNALPQGIGQGFGQALSRVVPNVPATPPAALNPALNPPAQAAPQQAASTLAAPPAIGGGLPGAMPGTQFLPSLPAVAPPPRVPTAAPAARQAGQSPYAAAMQAAENKYQWTDQSGVSHPLPPGVLHGIMMAESSGNPNARRLPQGNDPGSLGLMQFTPATARQYGINPRDPYQSIDATARYLQHSMNLFGGDVNKSIASYNAGTGAVARGRIPATTAQTYVPRVRQNMAKAPYLQKISKGLASMGGGTQGGGQQQASAPQPQQMDIPTQPINQKDYSDRLKNILGMTGLGGFGFAKGGGVHGDAAQDREQMLGILKERKLIKKTGGRAEFARGGISDLGEPPKKIPGKEVLHRAPLGHALLPVLHTTIVIGVSPKKGRKKGEGKADGGRLETAPNFPDTPPQKPRAIPPRRGKTPRGVGKALRGWGKTGR